ncbi:hypothetical protein E8E11_001941 [Didymella keratinophila]|nr:hypothetical protein E8E11_001941 [Didymella keratinophila]
MSCPKFIPLPAQQEATVAPSDLTFFDHQPQFPATQDATNSSFSEAIADSMLHSGSVLGADFAGWCWPDSFDLTQAPPSLQQSHLQTQAVPVVDDSAGNPVLLDPTAQPFEHNHAVCQPVVLDGLMVPDTQTRFDESWTIRKIEELKTMVVDLQAKTDQRMDLIEEEMKAVKSRLEDDTARLCEEVDDAILRLQTWTGQIRGVVDDALRSCASS